MGVLYIHRPYCSIGLRVGWLRVDGFRNVRGLMSV